MPSGKHSVSGPQPSRQTKPNASSTSEMLTAFEIESLWRSAREAIVSGRAVIKRRMAAPGQ